MRYFFEKRISTYMLFLGICLLGAISIGRIPVSLVPQVAYPGISVIVEYPGISPEKIETILTKPIEKIIKTVPSIQKITSVSEEGNSRINVSFEINTDIKIAALKVREKISLISDSFPREVQEPLVVRYDPSDRPVVIATISKKGLTLEETRDNVERTVKPKIERIDGISEIYVVGGSQKEIHIDIDQRKFEAQGISINQIFSCIQNNNVDLSGGIVRKGNSEYNVYSNARFKDINEIKTLPIMKTESGSLIRLEDIATVSFAEREKDDLSRYNGKDEIILYIHKAGDANTMSVCESIIGILNSLDGYTTKIVYNQGEFISQAITNVIYSCIIGFFIMLLILYFFTRQARVAIIIGITIPISILSCIVIMYFLNTQFNIISICGLALASGMVITNSILITECIYNRRNKIDSVDTVTSAIKDSLKPIVTATFASVAAFLPILFGDIYIKKMYGDLSTTISLTILISLFTSLVLIPALYIELSHNKQTADKLSFVKKSFIHKVITGISSGWHYVSTTVMHLISKNNKEHINKRLFEKPVIQNKYLGILIKSIIDTPFRINNTIKRTRSNGFLDRRYSKMYDTVLKNRSLFVKIVLITFFLSIFIRIMFIEVDTLDSITGREFYINVEMPTGSSLEFSDKAAKIAEKYLNTLDDVKEISTKVEKSRTTFTVKVKNSFGLSRKNISGFKDKIKKNLNADLAKVEAFVFISDASEVSNDEFDIIFLGNDTEQLEEIAKNAASKIQAIDDIDECILRFREGRPEYEFEIDRVKLDMYGISPYDFSSFLRTTIYGPVVTKFIDVDREVDVRLKYTRDQTDSLEKIDTFLIKTKQGELVYSSDLYKLQEKKSLTKIWRHNGRRCVTITAKIGAMSYSQAANVIKKALLSVDFPEEYTYEFDENIKKNEDSKRAMTLTFLLAVLLIYMILASSFESFLLPLIIMLTVPLSQIGIYFSLFIFSYSMNISVYIGLIIVSGISVGIGILFVDSIHNDYKNGVLKLRNVQAKVKSASQRVFKPTITIMITTISGLIPLLLNGSDGSLLWRPLALAVISGLLTSGIIIMFILPISVEYVYRNIYIQNNLDSIKNSLMSKIMLVIKRH